MTKALGEQVVKHYHDERGLPAVILRPTYVYGPREQGLIEERLSGLGYF